MLDVITNEQSSQKKVLLIVFTFGDFSLYFYIKVFEVKNKFNTTEPNFVRKIKNKQASF